MKPEDRISNQKSVRSLVGLQVLLIEDIEDTRDLFTFIFSEVGAEVVAVSTAKEAWEVIQDYQPDIIISNIMLPDEDGCSLLRRLKDVMAQRGKDVPAIAVTAGARESDRVRILSSGFLKHLSKPVMPDNLVEVVADIVGK